jgi:hypothetical protein
MKSYTLDGTGIATRAAAHSPPVPHTLPEGVFVPRIVRIDGDRLFAPPTATPIREPPRGGWRNLADIQPGDSRNIEAVAAWCGSLTEEGATEKGESLSTWGWLFEGLRVLAGAWTDEGDVTDEIEAAAARRSAHHLQAEIARNESARFVSAGPNGWALLTPNMHAWWTLAAINSVHQAAPFRRCRHCNGWFSLYGRRADAGFCCARHRSAFHQRLSPERASWVEALF